MVNVGKYTIHGSYGVYVEIPSPKTKTACENRSGHKKFIFQPCSQGFGKTSFGGKLLLYGSSRGLFLFGLRLFTQPKDHAIQGAKSYFFPTI